MNELLKFFLMLPGKKLCKSLASFASEE